MENLLQQPNIDLSIESTIVPKTKQSASLCGKSSSGTTLEQSINLCEKSHSGTTLEQSVRLCVESRCGSILEQSIIVQDKSGRRSTPETNNVSSKPHSFEPCVS